MVDPIHVILEDDWARLVNRIGARSGRTSEEVIHFALRHVEHLLTMETGETLVIRKTVGETDVTVQHVLGGGVDGVGGDGDASAGESGD